MKPAFRVLARVEKITESGCWLWMGAVKPNGYGNIGIGSRCDGTRATGLVHRVVYEDLVGPIPSGKQLDHLCRVRSCVNPAHLEAVDGRTNLLRGVPGEKRRTLRCLKGHDLSVSGSARERLWDGIRSRLECRECDRQAAARRRLVAVALMMLVAVGGCSNNPRPQPPQPPGQTCHGHPFPDPICQEGQTHSCWHCPGDSTTPLYACPVYADNCGVQAVINVVGGPAQCPAQPPQCQPTPPPSCADRCPTGTVCKDGVCVASPKPPEPSGPVPPIGQAVWPEKLLRVGDNGKGLFTAGGLPFVPFGVESCCMEWSKCPENTAPPGEPFGTGWPSISACFIKETRSYGANLYHVRWLPWYSDERGETLWKPVGNLYNEDGSFNQAFIDKHREYVYDIGNHGGYVEIILDDWWLKNACGKDATCDKKVPWPQSAVAAWGKHPEDTARSAYFKMVESFGCFGNVIFVTGNEEDLIPGVTSDHLAWRIQTIRDAERQVGCNFVHMIGTGSFKDGIPADYQVTHERTPVGGPCHGRFCANNEHNPEFPPDQEAGYFKQAIDAGQRWDAWRGGANDLDWEKRLDLFRQVVGGSPVPVGCYAPAPDDPLWQDPPTSPSVRPPQMMAAVNEAKARVGNRCGATAPCVDQPCAPPVHLGCLETNGLVAAELRKMGYCASGPWVDATVVLAPDGWWEEYHICSTGDGCYTGNPYKFAWKYKGANPTPPGPQPEPGQCTNPPAPTIHHINVKEHTKGPNKTVIDSTYIVHDSAYCASIGFQALDCPVRPEGDPQRATCEIEAGGQPQWVQLPPNGYPSPENPFQAWVPRNNPGTAKVCAAKTPTACGQVAVTP